MKKDDSVYIMHILDAMNKIEKYVKGIGHGDFVKNSLLQDAVIRELEIIGEAAKKLSADFREKYPDIPWKEMAGMRDKLIHEYFGVDLDAVWNTVEKDIPSLKGKINKIIEKNKKR